jgi:prepilin-type N-terminal cleavage/methylation domain-containing protein
LKALTEGDNGAVRNIMERLDCAGSNGFTLIEILMAMAVATAGLLSLALLQGMAIKDNTLSGRYTQATFLAQNILERVKDGHMVHDRTFGYSTVSDVKSDMLKDAGVLIGVNQKGDTGGSFDVQWQVTEHTDWSRKVTVIVSWESVIGRKRLLSLVSTSRGGGI